MKATGIDHHCQREAADIVFTLERRALHMRRRRTRVQAPVKTWVAPALIAPVCIDMPHVRPRLLLISSDPATDLVLQVLLEPEVFVNHVHSLADAREALAAGKYTLAVIDPLLVDGDAAELLPALRAAQLLVYSDVEPEWQLPRRQYLCKSQTSPRQLWSTIHTMLRLGDGLVAGD